MSVRELGAESSRTGKEKALFAQGIVGPAPGSALRQPPPSHELSSTPVFLWGQQPGPTWRFPLGSSCKSLQSACPLAARGNYVERDGADLLVTQ